MDKTQAIQAVLDESRNGVNEYIAYMPFRRFVVSDGVIELAKVAGSFWMLDILATELEPQLRGSMERGDLATVLVEFEVEAGGRRGWLRATEQDELPPYWSKMIPSPDWPEGKWDLFEIGPGEWVDEKGIASKLGSVICALISEH